MDFNIEVGIKGFETKIVELNDTAKVYGSGLAEVYATPALVALMENTAFKSIEDLLPDEFSTVGIQINVSHSKASLPGAIISCTSELVKIEGKKVFFNIIASDNSGDIGKAEHIRYIIDEKKFMENLKK